MLNMSYHQPQHTTYCSPFQDIKQTYNIIYKSSHEDYSSSSNYCKIIISHDTLFKVEIEQCSQKGMCTCFFHVNVHWHQTPKFGNSYPSSGKHIIIVTRHLEVIEINANSRANFHIHVYQIITCTCIFSISTLKTYANYAYKGNRKKYLNVML